MAVQVLLSMLVVVAVISFLALPVLRGVDEPLADSIRAELEDAKQAKYREIRDAELDYRAGKLTQDQWEETDRDLRREAMAILARIDTGGSAPGDAAGGKATDEAEKPA
jgi:hypothetical protein